MLSFAGLLFADAAITNDSYRAVATHRVEVTGTDPYCFVVPYRGGAGGRTFYTRFCRASYRYGADTFVEVTPTTWPLTYEVDSKDPSIRMDKARFDNGPVNVVGDQVGAILLLFGAALVTVIHQIHFRRTRARRRGLD